MRHAIYAVLCVLIHLWPKQLLFKGICDPHDLSGWLFLGVRWHTRLIWRICDWCEVKRWTR